MCRLRHINAADSTEGFAGKRIFCQQAGARSISARLGGRPRVVFLVLVILKMFGGGYDQ